MENQANLLEGVTIDWGFTAGDIFSNGMVLVGSLAVFVLLGIALMYAPKLIDLIKTAVK